MIRLLLIILFFLSSSPVYAEWVKTAESDNAILYADPDTIRRKGSLVKMWILYDFKARQQTIAGKSSWSFKSQAEYDCAEEQARALAVYDYSDPMGDGKIVYSHTNPDNWVPVIPGSMGDVSLLFACKKK